MTAFYMKPKHFDKWFHQNQGIYTGDFFEGVLLDNFVVATIRGYAFFYEHYLNSNSSDYLVYFIPYKAFNDPDYDRLWFDFLTAESNAREGIA